MPVVRGIRVLNAIATGNTTPSCLDTLLSDAGRLADVTQVLSSPQYACAFGQSNTASHTAMRSNNAMTALFANPTGSCVFYQTQTSRNNMLGSSCYYNYMMGFGNQSATDAFTHLGNTPCMLNCAFSSCTAFLAQATSSNTDIAKMLSCNACVRTCFIGTAQSKQEALGTPGRPAYWLSDASAFGYLTCCMLDTAFANTVFLETLNRDIACVMCTPAFNCCAWGTIAGANTYTNSACAINEVVNKGACCLNYTSCNFSCWYSSAYGVTCMTAQLASGNTYFIDQINSLGSFRQKSCLYYLHECKECYCSCTPGAPTAGAACRAQALIKTEVITRGSYAANNTVMPLSHYGGSTMTQRICNFCIANGSQLSNTEVEYLGRFSRCNYNVITHADCRFTLISPGFWNTSSMIACFKSCYCCSLDRTTANTSGLTLNCSLYYTTDNAATFNRLCLPLPACIFQQLCGNCCCQFTVRYGLSSFACCNYIYTGWIISDCGTTFGLCCTPAYFKTGHSRVCIHAANSQPNYDTWTHFPNVPLPFYTITFCDDYFAGVSPMRTDGYQSTLGLCNSICCQCPGQWALMFSFGKVGDCVRVSCDNFVNCVPTNVLCFTPATCCVACYSLPAATHRTWGTCYEDYFQGHGSGMVPYCMWQGACTSWDTTSYCRMGQNTSAASHTLIYKNPSDQTDSKAFLVGWRSFAMMYGGPVGGASGCAESCAQTDGRNFQFKYNCCTLRGIGEGLPYGCGYFANSPGVNVWCYGSQANNTMQGSELDCQALGGSTSASWTNWSFSNAKIVGNRLALAGTFPPRLMLCACCSCNGGPSTGVGWAEHIQQSYAGCQSAYGQIGHTTLFNTNGVVGTITCCLDSMFHQQPWAAHLDYDLVCSMLGCGWCSGRYGACTSYMVQCTFSPGGCYPHSYPIIHDMAGLKTLNLYGSSNSIYSFAVYPNIVVQCSCSFCNSGLCAPNAVDCYNSPATTGSGTFRSDRSNMTMIDAGDSRTPQHCCCISGNCYGWGNCAWQGYCNNCNPGNANTIAICYMTHSCSPGAYYHPCYFQGVYTPPSANQDTTAYNFCYVLTPNHDICLGGHLCWMPQCECYGANCVSYPIPCSPCCPNCNIVCCCIMGCLICDATRTTFPRAQVCYHCDTTYWPCCRTPMRLCGCICDCAGHGNHFYVVSQANATFQCATATNVLYECTCFNNYYYCICQTCSWTCHMISPISPSLRTCNQSGANCIWYDYITNAVCPPYIGVHGSKCERSYWNNQYVAGMCLNSSTACLCQVFGVAGCAIVADDSKRLGFRAYGWDNTCAFSVDGVVFPIFRARLTRGSGGFLNTQNSIHVAYFDLIPFRCTVSGGGGFYANGNACPSNSGLTCCLMYIKNDIFYNVT